MCGGLKAECHSSKPSLLQLGCQTLLLVLAHMELKEILFWLMMNVLRNQRAVSVTIASVTYCNLEFLGRLLALLGNS